MLQCAFSLQHPEEVFNWDISGTYEHHRNQLSLLSRRNGTEGKRWVLKCPVHLGYVRDLAKVTSTARCFAICLPSGRWEGEVTSAHVAAAPRHALM